MTNTTPGGKARETPLLLRLLIVLAVLGIVATLAPSITGVAQADYDTAPLGGGEPDL